MSSYNEFFRENVNRHIYLQYQTNVRLTNSLFSLIIKELKLNFLFKSN